MSFSIWRFVPAGPQISNGAFCPTIHRVTMRCARSITWSEWWCVMKTRGQSNGRVDHIMLAIVLLAVLGKLTDSVHPRQGREWLAFLRRREDAR